ncbi:CRISPR-associated endonuclease Cas1 [Avibacterium paragallinarum]|uniref:CRISPR-associated endonuclease Cas1 n=1 Tax=Avibacterium paragallinarum TaxID=728 RepID=A0ABU7QPS0_AVIPA|nr:CRISPR-associated endonuclease Cas1 [Avibacterium paragallinarum]
MSSLYIDRKGIEIKLNSEALACYENGERVGTIPLAPIDRVYLKGNVKLQASLLAKFGEKGIGIICLSGRKNTPTLFIPQPHNDAQRRIAQYQLSQNELFCLVYAKNVVLAKLITQKNWLWEAISKRPDKKDKLIKKVSELDSLISRVNEQPDLPALRGIEGRAAAVYFSALSQYLPPALDFQGRNRRPPRDPFNAGLSLCYTMLHAEAVLCAYSAGLDPYIGFYHSLDYGRESLACDLIEPLRPLVDNWLLGCFRREELRADHFTTTQEGCFLGKAGRVHFYQAYEKVIAEWRKILTENCYDLSKLFKEHQSNVSPQRRSSALLSSPEIVKDWQWQLQSYFFNLHTMLKNVEFVF